MKFKRDTTRKVKATVDLTPLIDVVFQLLIFFMLSATFVVQTSVPIEIPEAEGAEKFEPKNFTIYMKPGEGGPDNGGEIHVSTGQESPVSIADWNELTAALSVYHEEHPDEPILLNADKAVPHGRVVAVMGLASTVGITQYGFGAAPPSPGE